MDKFLIVIPARAGSKRLKHKNRVLVNGVPMFLISANASRKSQFNPRVVISTDDPVICDLASENKFEAISRTPYLNLDYAAKQDVIVDACNALWESEFYKPDFVISLQANSPGITSFIIDNALKKFLSSKQVNGCRELVCINPDGNQNGAIRIMNYRTVFQTTLSTYLNTITYDLHDIHTLEDIIDFESAS